MIDWRNRASTLLRHKLYIDILQAGRKDRYWRIDWQLGHFVSDNLDELRHSYSITQTTSLMWGVVSFCNDYWWLHGILETKVYQMFLKMSCSWKRISYLYIADNQDPQNINIQLIYLNLSLKMISEIKLECNVKTYNLWVFCRALNLLGQHSYRSSLRSTEWKTPTVPLALPILHEERKYIGRPHFVGIVMII